MTETLNCVFTIPEFGYVIDLGQIQGITAVFEGTDIHGWSSTDEKEHFLYTFYVDTISQKTLEFGRSSRYEEKDLGAEDKVLKAREALVSAWQEYLESTSSRLEKRLQALEAMFKPSETLAELMRGGIVETKIL